MPDHRHSIRRRRPHVWHPYFTGILVLAVLAVIVYLVVAAAIPAFAEIQSGPTPAPGAPRKYPGFGVLLVFALISLAGACGILYPMLPPRPRYRREAVEGSTGGRPQPEPHYPIALDHAAPPEDPWAHVRERD